MELGLDAVVALADGLGIVAGTAFVMGDAVEMVDDEANDIIISWGRTGLL